MEKGVKERKIVHLIGHAHIDPVWLWEWREGFSEVRNTFRSAICLMEKYPDWKFTAGSVYFYELLRDIEPELFEKIRGRVTEGRWEYVGCFYVEPDCNLPCGESFIRHGLFSQLFFERSFGRRAKVGFAPDSFGHTGSLPQILKKLGIDYYVFMRPSPPREKKYEEGTTFIWESPGGFNVVASVIPESYGGDVKEVLKKINNISSYPYWVKGQKNFLCFFGVGNHRGGPTAETLEAIFELKKSTQLLSIEFSTLEEYFEKVLESSVSLPKIFGGLYHHARGCYSVYSTVKRLNRETEHFLITAEKFATLGWTLGYFDYPTDELEKAWKLLLFCQFHDILAGTSIKKAYDDVKDFFGYSRCVSREFTNKFIQMVSKEINTEKYETPIIFFNPLPWSVSEVVSISEFVGRNVDGEIEFTDDQGKCVPYQIVSGDRPGGKEFALLVKVPSMGYRVFSVRKRNKRRSRASIPKESVQVLYRVTEDILENQWWRVILDNKSGGVRTIIDKGLGIEVVKHSFLPVPILDSSDTWSHDIDEFRVEAGSFTLVDSYLQDLGEILARYIQIFEFASSKVIQKITVYSGLPYIDIKLDILWNERYIALKWKVNTNFTNGTATYEIPFCVEVREPTGGEEPAHQWIDLSGKIDTYDYGVSIITDSNYGYDIKDNIMRVTLLRSPAYAHHDPVRVDAKNVYPIIDQGVHTFGIRVLPHKGDWRSVNLPRVAMQFNVPIISQFESNHNGIRKTLESFLEVDKENIIVSTLKKSERDNSLIIRAYESFGTATDCNIKLNFWGLSFKTHFSPFEIKTFKCINGKIKETNLLED